MVSNYYILKELSLFLNSELKGYIIKECFSQEKDKLIILLSDPEISSRIKFLEYSCERKIPYLLVRKDFSKARKNYAKLFIECEEKEISDVCLLNDDRVIQIIFTDNSHLLFNFIPFKYNVFYVSGFEILKSFKSDNLFAGKKIDIIFEKKSNPELKINTSNKAYLKNLNRGLEDIYIREILYLSGLNKNEQFNPINEEMILKNYKEIIYNIMQPKYILYENKGIPIISLMNLNIMKDSNYREFTDINSIIESYVRSIIRIELKAELKKKLIAEIQMKILHLERKIDNLKRQKSNAENYEESLKFGKIIISNIDKISQGDILFKYKDESENIEISVELDKELTPSQNAQKYFDKYKKQRDNLEVINKILLNSERNMSELQEKLNKLNSMEDFKELKKEVKGQSSETNDTESKHFRKFILNENFQILVGRNAASNDLLTFKYANQNDLWFHVRGFSGSHTILRKTSKSLDIPKEIVKKAASVAAYYSKARNSGTVAVAYTERKYVKKRKGFKDGSVTMDREKVVFVKPGLPLES